MSYNTSIDLLIRSDPGRLALINTFPKPNPCKIAKSVKFIENSVCSFFYTSILSIKHLETFSNGSISRAGKIYLFVSESES